ncbi:MAG: 4Fe-4S cluster-binding domain-containing protein [Cyanobacteria bacterium RI_101]|nr:4Fe-4S cluster-binding domain-containing protein [Cyanobacteria bacterium RI_101]
MVTYPVVETFHSLQGEGSWTGASAFFIRLGGCDVHCPWCDQKETWDARRSPQTAPEVLVEAALAARPRFVVITGGEPLLHDLGPLTAVLAQAGLRRHLETSGAYALSGRFDWITLSPKPYKPPHPSLYPQTSELKVVVAQPEDLLWAEDQSRQVPENRPRYLQPEWGTAEAPQWIADYILGRPHWRLSLQTHKYLGLR